MLVLAAVTLTAPVTVITFITGSLVPLLVALVTKWNVSPLVKGLINVALSSVVGVLTTLVASVTTETVTFDLLTVLAAIGVAIVSSQTFWSLIWKQGPAQTLTLATKDFGVGAKTNLVPIKLGVREDARIIGVIPISDDEYAAVWDEDEPDAAPGEPEVGA